MYTARNQIVKTYWIWIKRWLFLSSFFLMFIAIQTYVNYTTIIENTLLVQQQTQRVKDEMSYYKAFQLKYLNSVHAPKLLAHENGVLEYNESIINFKTPVISSTWNNETLKNTYQKKTPREEWKNFFWEKREII